MTSIGTGYDLTAAIFAPDGRLFQTLYAEKAVHSEGTMIAIKGKDGVLIAIEKTISCSRIVAADTCPRIFCATQNIVVGLAGLFADCSAIRNYIIEEVRRWLEKYREPIGIESLVDSLGQYKHIFTLGIHRPFAVSTFLASWNSKDGSRIFHVEPNGTYFEYNACIVGRYNLMGRTELEKVKNSLREFNLVRLSPEAAKILIKIRTEETDNQLKVEMGWTGATTGAKRVDHLICHDFVEAAKVAIDREGYDSDDYPPDH